MKVKLTKAFPDQTEYVITCQPGGLIECNEKALFIDLNRPGVRVNVLYSYPVVVTFDVADKRYRLETDYDSELSIATAVEGDGICTTLTIPADHPILDLLAIDKRYG